MTKAFLQFGNVQFKYLYGTNTSSTVEYFRKSHFQSLDFELLMRTLRIRANEKLIPTKELH